MSTATEQVWTLGALMDWTAKGLADQRKNRIGSGDHSERIREQKRTLAKSIAERSMKSTADEH